MTHAAMDALLDKVVAKNLTPADRLELMAQLDGIQGDADRSNTERMAAIVLRLMLEADAEVERTQQPAQIRIA